MSSPAAERSLRCGGDASCPRSRFFELVGYGDASDFEGAAPVAALGADAAVRARHGCEDTEDNANDFRVEAPEPKNDATEARDCLAPQAPDAGAPPTHEEVADAAVDATHTEGEDEDDGESEAAPSTTPSKSADAGDEGSLSATDPDASSGCAFAGTAASPIATGAAAIAALLTSAARRRRRRG